MININSRPPLLIIALSIILFMELYSIYTSGFHIIRIALLAPLLYFTFNRSSIAKRYLIMLLSLGIGLAIYQMIPHRENMDAVISLSFFIIIYLVAMILLLYPSSVKSFFRNQTKKID